MKSTWLFVVLMIVVTGCSKKDTDGESPTRNSSVPTNVLALSQGCILTESGHIHCPPHVPGLDHRLSTPPTEGGFVDFTISQVSCGGCAVRADRSVHCWSSIAVAGDLTKLAPALFRMTYDLESPGSDWSHVNMWHSNYFGGVVPSGNCLATGPFTSPNGEVRLDAEGRPVGYSGYAVAAVPDGGQIITLRVGPRNYDELPGSIFAFEGPRTSFAGWSVSNLEFERVPRDTAQGSYYALTSEPGKASIPQYDGYPELEPRLEVLIHGIDAGTNTLMVDRHSWGVYSQAMMLTKRGVERIVNRSITTGTESASVDLAEMPGTTPILVDANGYWLDDQGTVHFLVRSGDVHSFPYDYIRWDRDANCAYRADGVDCFKRQSIEASSSSKFRDIQYLNNNHLLHAILAVRENGTLCGTNFITQIFPSPLDGSDIVLPECDFTEPDREAQEVPVGGKNLEPQNSTANNATPNNATANNTTPDNNTTTNNTTANNTNPNQTPLEALQGGWSVEVGSQTRVLAIAGDWRLEYGEGCFSGGTHVLSDTRMTLSAEYGDCGRDPSYPVNQGETVIYEWSIDPRGGPAEQDVLTLVPQSAPDVPIEMIRLF